MSSCEVRSFPIKQLIRQRSNLAHVSDIVIVLANYQLQEHWFMNPTIKQRFESMEVCPTNDTLFLHLRLDINVVKNSDMIAVSATDANVLQRLISD